MIESKETSLNEPFYFSELSKALKNVVEATQEVNENFENLEPSFSKFLFFNSEESKEEHNKK